MNLVPYLNTLLVICCPIGFCFFLFCFWFGYKFHKKLKFSVAVERFLITSAITFFYFQAPIINALAGMLNCSQIDNESYISDYPLEQCSHNARYSEWKKCLLLPAACFFVFILPIWPLYYMHKNKAMIFHKDVIYKIGFLLNGYSPNNFYWYNVIFYIILL